MKKLFTLFAVLAVLALAFILAPPAFGQAVTSGYVSKRDNTVATNSVVIWPGAAGHCLALTEYDVTGDNADAVLQLLSGTTVTRIQSGATTANLTNIHVLASTSFAAGDIAVLQKASDGTVNYAFVLGASTTNLHFSVTNATVLTAGDYIWRMNVKATNAVGNATVRKAGAGLFGAQLRAPLMLRLYTASGTNESINSATANYFVPQ